MSDSLSGRVAVVTGAARGIGDAIAERLLADGARVFSLDKASPMEPRDGVVDLEADVTGSDILVACGIQRIGLVGKVSFADVVGGPRRRLSSRRRPACPRGNRARAR